MTKTWSVFGRNYSNIKNKIDFEKVKPRTKKLVKVIKGKCGMCDGDNSLTFTKQMIKREDFY